MGIKPEIYVYIEKRDFTMSSWLISRVVQMAQSSNFYSLSSMYHL